VLLSKGVTEEEIIVPTLAFASAVDYGIGRARIDREQLAASWGKNNWKYAALWFSHDYESLIPLGFVDGVLLLRRATTIVELAYPERDAKMPHLAYIMVFESPKTPTPKHVAEVYEETLTANTSPGMVETTRRWPDMRCSKATSL